MKVAESPPRTTSTVNTEILEDACCASPLPEVAAWPEPLAKAFRRRLSQLIPVVATGEDLLAAELRAFAELTPEGTPWRSIVGEWPACRRERYAALLVELEEFGLPRIDSERRAFVAIAAEDDGPATPRLDLAELARSSTD